MKRRNSSDVAYEREQMLLAFTDSKCPQTNVQDLSEFDDAIAEAENMLHYSMDMGWNEEVSSWRKMIQRLRVEKRNAKVEINKRMVMHS